MWQTLINFNRATAPRTKVGIENSKLELLANIWEGKKVLHSKKFVSLCVPYSCLALTREWLPRPPQTSDF